MAKQKKDADEPKKKTMYTIVLTDEQMEKLKGYCDYQLWEFYTVEYARFACKHKGLHTNLVGYNSGKLVVSGKGTEDFVIDVLESEITKDPRMGYDEVHHPEWFELHAGLDESGKGDLFGPVVCATVIADSSMVHDWIEKGVKDSKTMTDSSILRLDKLIRKTKGVVVETSFCPMPRYNQLMSKPKANLNKLLGWLHAKALEAALQKKRAPWGMLDQFSKKPLVQEYLKNPDFDLRMETKAESDPVVAAASIVARATYVREMQKLSKSFGDTLKKGCGAGVKKQAIEIVTKFGPDILQQFAKMHFKTAYEALGRTPPEKKAWQKF